MASKEELEQRLLDNAEALREVMTALRRYGRHLGTCEVIVPARRHLGCTCGWEKFLSEHVG